MTIARDFLRPIFLGTVILPLSSISTTDKVNPSIYILTLKFKNCPQELIYALKWIY